MNKVLDQREFGTTGDHVGSVAPGETLVRVDGLGKKFCRDLKKSLWYGMTDIAAEIFPGRRDTRRHDELRQGEFWAVEDLSFELCRGEVLGLIGHNGAGKTTVLKMLNGLIKPDRGRIEIRGRVGALIALGAGFNPVLTGRENVLVNAAVLGLSRKETEDKLAEIVEFSGLHEFIDAPVQSYSSGMTVRLGFSVAAILIRPEVLLLDEVLAVGDHAFTTKCLNTVRSLTRNAAVIFVSHNMQYISSFCTKLMLLEHGKALRATHDLSLGIDAYLALAMQEPIQITGTGQSRVLSSELIADGEKSINPEPVVPRGAFLSLELRVVVDDSASGALLSLSVIDETTSPVISSPVNTSESEPLILPRGESSVIIPLWPVDLRGGKYSFVVVLKTPDSGIIMVRAQGLAPFRVPIERPGWGKILRPAIVGKATSS